MALNLQSVGRRLGPIKHTYEERDTMLYALGVGAGFDELPYVYEQDLKVIPTFGIAAIFSFLAEVGQASEADLTGILHGEQEMTFYRPIPPKGTLLSEGKITKIYDKGKDRGAIVIAESDTVGDDGKKLFSSTFTLFSRRDGGFGGENAPAQTFSFPERAPDFVEVATPSKDQPLLYRLSGDRFPLHADPEFAKMSGFQGPIMHGLCTYGYACRAVLKHLTKGDPTLLRRFGGRFSKPLYPGETIKTEIWKTGERDAFFRVIHADSGAVIIDRGVVEFGQVLRDQIRFDDQVAVITGAGGGLGRAYALDLARRGAKVVVNDLGGKRDGTGEASLGPAEKVVEEIRALGGEAIADGSSVATPEGGEALIAAAVQAFGRVDILINNAGILRDKSFLKTEPSDWEAVMAVHLDGAYHVTKPAFRQMKEQGYGRIVMTTSAAGLYGNFGQANYSAAKLALVGLMQTLKQEGAKYSVFVNTVAPLAASRMTEDVMPPDMLEKLKPEYVAPLVVFLASSRCQVTGRIYNAGMGRFSRAAVFTGPGALLRKGDEAPKAEEIRDQIATIARLDGASGKLFDSAMDAIGTFQSGPWEVAPPKASKAEGSASSAPSSGGQTTANGSGGGGDVAATFGRIGQAFQADKAAGVNVVFQFALTGQGGGDWSIVVKDGTCTAEKGRHASPTVTLQMDAADFLLFVGGKLDPMQAFQQGKLKVSGDMLKSRLIQKLFRF